MHVPIALPCEAEFPEGTIEGGLLDLSDGSSYGRFQYHDGGGVTVCT
jgi:hypothetical protein